MVRDALALAAALLVGTAPAAAAITIGPGPVRGTDLAGTTWHEDLQDWTHADLRALDEHGDVAVWSDGHDTGRDLVAFSSRFEGDQLDLRVDFFDLNEGWPGSLNLYIAVDCAPGGAQWLPDYLDVRTDHPWEICLALYAAGDVAGTTYNVYDSGYGTGWNAWFGGSSWRADLDAVEMKVPRSLLTAAGWNGTSAVAFQVATAKDFAEGSCAGGGASSDLADAIVDDDRGCGDGSLDGAIMSDATAGRVQYASVAHGNQSLNRASDLRVHVYDPPGSTGISGGTGFVRTLDTHRIFGVPLNIHASGTLLSGLQWSPAPGGASDPSDGPSLLAEIGRFADADQQDRPGALIGGVFAEHILPYFEGAANAASFAVADSLHARMFGLAPSSLKVMHVPERVIRSLPTGLSPLDGFTFADILDAGYDATYLDAAAHLHRWFYPTENLWPDAAYRHKAHRVNGVLCWMINHREDATKFWVQDGGLHLDARASLLEKALSGDPQLVLVFDDWEALAGKSFAAVSGQMVPNDNPNLYQQTVRWLANHPWIEMVTLADMTDRAQQSPATWVIDHGQQSDLDITTYHWLQHACEDSYHNWYYDSAGGVRGNEQSFYDLVPVISGEQGDYRARGVGPWADGPGLPSQMAFGDLNTPGTLLHDTWQAIAAMPAGGLKQLAEASFSAMIYETAWHEEDATDYADGDGFGAWLYPDTSWDGLSGWALRLHNHARDAVALSLAAAWGDSLRDGLLASVAATRCYRVDADLDGEQEVVLRNGRVWTLWQARGGRCLLGVQFDQARDEAVVLIGNPLTNPSAPGEEEYADGRASRCSGYKVMNGGYADQVFTLTPAGGGLTAMSPDGLVQLTHALAAGEVAVQTAVAENVPGALYLRLGLSPDPWRLLLEGHVPLSREHDGATPAASTRYTLYAGAPGFAAPQVTVRRGSAAFVANPLHAGEDRRDLALTEEVELAGDGTFAFSVELGADQQGEPAPEQGPPAAAIRGLTAAPNPFNPRTRIACELAAAGPVRVLVLDLAGRVVRRLIEGERREAGTLAVDWDGVDDAGRAAPAGGYVVRVESGARTASRCVSLVR